MRLVEDHVQVRPLGPSAIKGLPNPIEVFELTGISNVRSRFQAAAARGLTQFVGRDPEMEQLRLALERAAAGRGPVVAIVGEPGVGKSRLYWGFTRSHRTHGWLLLATGSVSHGKATSYLPIIELLTGYFQIEARDEPRRVREKITGKRPVGPRLEHESWPAQPSCVGDLAAGRDRWEQWPGRRPARGRSLSRGARRGHRPRHATLLGHCHLGLGKVYQRAGKREPAGENLATAATIY